MTDYTPEISAAMNAGMDAESRRRQVASETPGYGAAVALPDNPVGMAVGKSGLLPAVGEGHSVIAEVSQAVHKAYGPDRPQYADSLIGGVGYAPVGVVPALRHVTDLGDGRVFVEGRRAPAGDGVIVASAGPIRGRLWSRLLRSVIRK